MTADVHGTRAADYVRRPLVSTLEGIDAEMCAWLFRRPEFRALRIAARGAHPRAYAMLTAATVLGNEWCDTVNGSTNGTAPRKPAETPGQSSEWMNVTAVAALLNVTPRRVRQLCSTGNLKADNLGRPIGWRINCESLSHYQARHH